MPYAWDQFFRHLQPYVPGCPEVTMEDHLRDAAVMFCARSEAWRVELGPAVTVAGTQDYTVTVPANTDIENVVELYLNDVRLKRVSDLYAALAPGAPTARPNAFAVLPDGQLRFFSTPDDAYTFGGQMVLKPSLAATGVEDFLFVDHAKSIAYGALSTVLLIPGKEWSNPDMANYFRAKFFSCADEAKLRDTRRSNLRVSGPTFA